jgi:hypothetical protein
MAPKQKPPAKTGSWVDARENENKKENMTTYQQLVVPLKGLATYDGEHGTSSSLQITTAAMKRLKRSRAQDLRWESYNVGAKPDSTWPVTSGHKRIVEWVQRRVRAARKIQAENPEEP